MSVFDSTVRRLLADGSIDPVFGNGSVASLGNPFEMRGITLQSNGKIVVVGTVPDVTTRQQAIWVARLNSNGTGDTTFGVGGTTSTPYAAPSQSVGVAMQADGKIVVAGDTLRPNQPNMLLTARFFGDPVP